MNGLHKLGEQILLEFARNLEAYRRAKSEEAEYIARVQASAPRHHLADYLGPGGWLEDASKSIAIKLDSATRRLFIYLNEAHECLDHLLGISRDAAKAQSEMEVTTQLEKFDIDGSDSNNVENERERRVTDNDGRLSYTEYSSMTGLIYKMLDENYDMQRNIVEALGFDTPSDVMKKYCAMWADKPCIKSYVIERARAWVDTSETVR